MYNILICDDEEDIVAALKIYLSNGEYNVFTAYTGRQALQILQQQEIHLVLMDIMMPELDGLQTVTQLRQNSNIPVIFLSAKGEEADKILGLDVGADDYVTKPFGPTELLARVRSQLRRYTQLGSAVTQPHQLTIGNITLCDKAKQVTVDGEPVALTPTEYEILKLLMQHPRQVFSPKTIYTKVWKDDPYGAENTVAVHIRHLREKVELDPSEPRYLKVVWGQGYKIEGGR